MTDTSTPADPATVVVIQADRDAAADLELAVGDKALSYALRAGTFDDSLRVQAFARHRQAHQSPPVVAMGREALERMRNYLIVRDNRLLACDGSARDTLAGCEVALRDLWLAINAALGIDEGSDYSDEGSIALNVASTPAEGRDVREVARELLAAEFEADGLEAETLLRALREGRETNFYGIAPALRAITAALSRPDPSPDLVNLAANLRTIADHYEGRDEDEAVPAIRRAADLLSRLSPGGYGEGFDAAAIAALTKHICYTAYSMADPQCIRFRFANDEDRAAAANALDEAFAHRALSPALKTGRE